MNNIVKYIGFICLGIIIGNYLPQGFFRPWYGDEKTLYAGDNVIYSTDDNFYSLCEGKIEYIHTQEAILVRWSKCKESPFPQYNGWFLDLHSSDTLKRKG